MWDRFATERGFASQTLRCITSSRRSVEADDLVHLGTLARGGATAGAPGSLRGGFDPLPWSISGSYRILSPTSGMPPSDRETTRTTLRDESCSNESRWNESLKENSLAPIEMSSNFSPPFRCDDMRVPSRVMVRTSSGAIW